VCVYVCVSVSLSLSLSLSLALSLSLSHTHTHTLTLSLSFCVGAKTLLRLHSCGRAASHQIWQPQTRQATCQIASSGYKARINVYAHTYVLTHTHTHTHKHIHTHTHTHTHQEKCTGARYYRGAHQLDTHSLTSENDGSKNTF